MDINIDVDKDILADKMYMHPDFECRTIAWAKKAIPYLSPLETLIVYEVIVKGSSPAEIAEKCAVSVENISNWYLTACSKCKLVQNVLHDTMLYIKGD